MPAFAGLFVHVHKQLFELTEGVIDHRPNRPQRVMGGGKVIELLDTEQALDISIGSAHALVV